MKQVVVAKSAGFCFGVQRSVDLAEKLLAERESVCSLGRLIHNAEVVASLRARGLPIEETWANQGNSIPAIADYLTAVRSRLLQEGGVRHVK